MHGQAPKEPIEKFTLEYGIDIDPIVEVQKAIQKHEAGRTNFLQAMRDMMGVYGGRTKKVEQ